MPVLEVVTLVPARGPGEKPPAFPPGEYRLYRELPPDLELRLGRDEKYDVAVPEDDEVSRFNAILKVAGTDLLVERRGILPEFPDPPAAIYYHGKPLGSFTLRLNESFQIGRTTFTLRASAVPLPPKLDGTAPQQVQTRAREELQRTAFADQHLATKLYPIWGRLGAYTEESGLFDRMVTELHNALPRVQAVAVVLRPDVCPTGPGGDVEVQVLAAKSHGPAKGEAFRPSRKLVKAAVCDHFKSCRYEWPTDANAATDMTLTGHIARQPDTAPWAVCTPFQDGSNFALYLTGVEPHAPGSPLARAVQDDYQKFAEVAVQMAESVRDTIRLKRKLALAELAWPTPLRKRLDDPDKFGEQLRSAHKTQITVLFCDLRGYSRYAEQMGDDLHASFAPVQRALEVMSAAVTFNRGIVAGFRGDAVLGFWGWPEPLDDQIERAASAAQSIFEQLWGTIIDRRCGLGLTHGTALVGRLGALDLAPVDLYGPVVNLAFRLEEMTKAYGVGIVVSDVVAARLRADGNRDRFRLRDLGTVVPRGMANPLTVSELAPSTPIANYDSWLNGPAYVGRLRAWNEALKRFNSGDWEDAHARLDANEFAVDSAALYLKKEMDLLNRKRPPGWKFTPRKLD